jgi:hypothetical protein
MRSDREAMFLGIIALVLIAGLYPLYSFLFYWESWLVMLIISLPCIAIFLAARGFGSYMKDLKSRGVITERDEFWVNMMGFGIIFACFMFRR